MIFWDLLFLFFKIVAERWSILEFLIFLIEVQFDDHNEFLLEKFLLKKAFFGKKLKKKTWIRKFSFLNKKNMCFFKFFLNFYSFFEFFFLIFIQQTMLLIQKYIFYFQNKKIHEQKKTIVMKNTFIFYNFICCVSCKCVFL